MPLYLVRWPNLSACIVNARSEDHLINILDELDDPGSCTWEEYDGPLWVEFEVPVKMVAPEHESPRRPLLRDEVAFEGLKRFDHAQMLRAEIPGAETAVEMHNEIMERCFPSLLGLLGPECQGDEWKKPTAEQFKEALLAELEGYLQGSWQASARNPKER